MMTTIGGIAVAALLFGVLAVLRPSDRAGGVGCSGDCGACTNDRACETKGVRP